MNEGVNQTNSKFNIIFEIIKHSIEVICESQREKDVQDILASQLDSNSRQTLSSEDFPDVEVDIIGDDYAIEIKHNEKYYAGFCQVLAQRLLYNIKNVYLIHINEYLNPKFTKAFFKLAEELKIVSILVNKRSKEILVKP